MATVSPGLRPSTMPLAYNNLRTGVTPPRTPSVLRDSLLGGDATPNKLNFPTLQSADPKLTIVDIENTLRDYIRKRPDDLFMAFQNYDANTSLSVTKGEFRRVLESYCLPLTTEQFDALMNKVEVNPNGTVRYCDFMDKFGASTNKLRNSKNGSAGERWKSGSPKYIRTQSPKEMNTDMIEKMLKDKIQSNMRNVIKGLRLHDYNRDGHIQKHELRKVLENYCFRMSDSQFDKLYQRYDFHHRGMLNYKEFLQRLGVHVEEINKPPPSRGMPSAFNWQEFAEQQRQATTPQLGINNRYQFEDQNPGAKLAGMGLHSVESEFRKLMRENYTNIKRMFMVFDKYNDGFIHLEDLKAILSQFTLPMSDQLFSQLMDRCGVKASGKVSWEYFLERFQDPQSHGNGQTITIKPGHRYNPIRGVDAPVSLHNVVKLLIEQVQRGYSSLKQAFLEIDKNRDGKITRKELRKVLDGFKVRITDHQMRQLYMLLDPTHSNIISYHRFLDLFEERETQEGHKWLKSCHRFNENPKPIIMAWETIDEIVKNKLQDNWKDLSAALVNCDDKNTQRILPKELRRCIERFSIPISEAHFNHLLMRMEDFDDDKVNYVEFLTKLGVSVKPGDLQGLSTQIHQGSIEAEVLRTDEQIQRQARGEVRAQNKTDSMNAEEIITRLRDKMAQETSKIRKAFLKYDTKKNGKVSKKEFRKVLESMGFNMSDYTYETICAKLDFKNGKMQYTDFIASFEDPRIGGPAAELVKENNHKVNPIRGDEYGLTAIEVESKLRNKLRENFEDLRGAFYKFDDDHNGLLTKGNLRRMLDAFMCPMTDDEFTKLCERLNISKKTRISYKDFLEKFEVRDTEEGHKWLISDHRFNEVKPVRYLTAEEVHAALNKKAHQQYADLSKAFRMIDTKKDGIIKKNELKSILQKFVLPVENDEFQKLWRIYDKEGKGFITHEDFLKRLGGEEFAPSDLNGMSYSIIKESYTKLDRHHKDQQVKHETITERQAHHAEAMSVDTILQQLKDRIREQYNDFYTAFKKYDTNKRGYLTSNDIQKVLTDFNYFVDDDQFYDLLERLKLHEKRRLTYDDFLAGFQEGRKENYAGPQDVGMSVDMDMGTAPDQVDSKLRGKISPQIDILQKAFYACDQRGTGHIALSDFRRVIDNFCCKLNDAQFKQVANKLPLNRDRTVDYVNYLESFKMSEIDADKWIDSINKRMKSETPAILTEDEVNGHLHEQIAAKYYPLSKAFTEIDYARIGVVTRDDLRNVLNQFTIRLNEEQFDRLWSTLPINEFGNVDYNKFLQRFTADVGNYPRPVTSMSTPVQKRPNTASSELARLSADRASVMSNLSATRSFTPMVNAENVERRLKDVVYRHWKDIQRTCRAADTENTGQIPYEAFRGIIKRLDGSILDDDMNTLFLKYDLKNNNHFCYTDFLRHFVLTMQQQREGSLLNRKKMQPVKVATSITEESPEDASTRLEACIKNNWKEMRRDLGKLDTDNTGVVSATTIRQVLRNYKLNLDESEFHSLMSMYDKDLNGQINYKNFLKAFIQGQ